MKKIVFALMGLALLSACNDDDDNNGGGQVVTPPTAIIGIEGTSPNGISSLAAYDMSAQTVENNIFRKANINPMGSQLSDILFDEELNQLVLVVAGSDKLVYIDADDYVIQRQIKDLMTIREAAKVNDFLYYVTSPGLGGVYAINSKNGRIRAEIEIDNITNPTAIKVWNDLAFITNSGDPITADSTISIVRVEADTFVRNINVGHAPNSMAIDPLNNLWVLCSGKFDPANPFSSGVGSLWKFNLDSIKMAIDSNTAFTPDTVRYFLDNQLRPNSLTFDPTIGNFYYLKGAPTGDIAMTSMMVPAINENSIVTGSFYGLAYDPVNLEIYGLKTPSEIEDDGFLEVFDPVGNRKVSIRIGVKPTDVVFK